jgi:lysophospholipase L1-like esterase
MPKRFFMRFNLQNGVGHFPTTADVGAALQNTSLEEIQSYLHEFDEIQTLRTQRIKERMGNSLSSLHRKKAVFIGDSITSDNLGYRETVCRAADLIGVDASISGGTSATAVQLVYTTLAQARPDIVSIMLGSNDSVSIGYENFEQVSLSEYERNLRAILSWATESGASILLLSILPIQQERFDRCFTPQSKFQSNSNIARYNTILQSLADEFDIPLLRHEYTEHEETFNTFMEHDGIHLNANGQEALAEYWLRQAVALFEKDP